MVLVDGTNLRQLAGDGARLAVAFNYHNALMPFYVADDEYDLPEVWKRADVDRELIDYARHLRGDESKRPV